MQYSRDLNTEHIRYSKGGPQHSQSGLYYIVYILDICIYVMEKVKREEASLSCLSNLIFPLLEQDH